MEGWQTRLLAEYSELSEKRKDLEAFLARPEAHGNIVPAEMMRLRKQLYLMTQYEDVLAERIRNFRP